MIKTPIFKNIFLASILILVLCLSTACAPQGENTEDGNQPQNSGSTEPVELPETAQSREGLVLDASDGQFIFRATDGAEYVFRMSSAADRVEGGVKAGQFVRIWFDGPLIEPSDAAKAKLLRIEPAQEGETVLQNADYVAQGTLVRADETEIVLQLQDGEYRFPAGETVRRLPAEPREGMWVRVTFDGTLENPVVSRAVQSTAEPDALTVRGTILEHDENKQTIVMQTDFGEKLTFSLTNAEMDSEADLRSRRRVMITYTGRPAEKDDSPDKAQVLRVQPDRENALQTLQGVMCAGDARQGKISLCTANGKIRTFRVNSGLLEEDGLKVGTSVRVTYTEDFSETDQQYELKITEIRDLGEKTQFLFGTVQSSDNHQLVLQAEDGRTLELKSGSELVPADIKSGDKVCVAYNGWIADTAVDTAEIHSVSYFFA